MTCNCDKIVEQRKVLHRSGKSRQEAIWHIFWTGNISAIMHLVSLTCVLQDMSNELDIGKIVAELSGTTAEQAKSLIAQRKALGLNQTEWRLLLFQVHGTVRQEVGVQMEQCDGPGTLLTFTLQMLSCSMATCRCCCCIQTCP